MKKLLLALAGAFALSSATADEGMWLPSLIGSRIDDMRSKGFRLTAEDIYSVNEASMKDAVVLFGGGCTGEIVSAEGLLLTNHHCGYGAIQSHSTVDHDYLTYGFWARSRDEELPNEKLSVKILVRMEEVTDRIAPDRKSDPAKGLTTEEEPYDRAKAAELIRAAEAEGPGYKAAVEPMYYGNQLFLFVYQEFRDVRLVGAPPSSIGKFGGDTDNWIWPRHTGDFSVFRIYADRDNNPAAYSPDNVPYRPKRHFTVSTAGVKEGDFTMIYGFPGSTQEYIISDAVDYVQNLSDPMKIDLRTRRLDIISAAQAADPKVRIQYASKHADIANAWKKWQGEAAGLKRMNTLAEKRAYEKRFAAWAADKPEYAHLLDSMRAAYDRNRESYFRYELQRESSWGLELYGAVTSGIMLTKWYGAKTGASDELRTALRAEREKFFRNYDPAVDRALTKSALHGLEEYRAECFTDEARQEIGRHGGIDRYVDFVFDRTRFLGPEEQFAGLDSAAIADDPGHRLLRLFARKGGIRTNYRNLSNLPDVERWYRPYLKALMEFDTERAFFPDANLTLRVAYGSVAGYWYADGEYHTPQTTLDGIIAKDNPDIYDYDIPQRLRDLYAAKEYGRWGAEIDGRLTVPVCFLATNQTTGGNSGSPVLNGSGELVGINFDRTWRSTMSDIVFDPTICRNIAVDIRYVLFVIDKVGGAGYLLDEMGL